MEKVVFHTNTVHNSGWFFFCSPVLHWKCGPELWPLSEQRQDVCWNDMWILITENICSHNNSRRFQIKCAGGLKAEKRHPVRQILSPPEIQTWPPACCCSEMYSVLSSGVLSTATANGFVLSKFQNWISEFLTFLALMYLCTDLLLGQ